VGIDTGISRGSSQILSLSERNMLSLGVFITLGQPEINDVDIVFIMLCPTNQEVIWFDISVDNSFLMDFLDSLYHLDSNLQNSLKVKFPSALLEEIF